MNNNDTRSDDELIAALNDGDNLAFDALYYRYRDWVVRLAYRFTANDEDALDVLQETFAYFHRKFPGFVLTSRLTTFFYPVVKNLALAIRRKRRPMIHALDALDLLPAPNPTGTSRDELAAALSGIPSIQREVLLMRFVDDMSLDEIALALQIPLGTAKSRIHNALQTLRADPSTRNYFFDQ